MGAKSLAGRYRRAMRSVGRGLRRLEIEVGATAIEYGLVAILIAVLAVVAVGLLGESVSALFSDAANSF